MGKQDAKGGAAISGYAFDDAAVIADNFCDKSQAQAPALGFRRDKGIEYVGTQIFADARPVVVNANLKGQ